MPKPVWNRRAIEEYERQTEHLKIDLHDLEKCRERDQQDHIRNLENAKVPVPSLDLGASIFFTACVTKQAHENL